MKIIDNLKLYNSEDEIEEVIANIEGFDFTEFDIEEIGEALMYIADAHPAQKANTAAFLKQELSSLAYIRRITQETGCDPAYVLSKDIYNNVQIWAKR